MNKITFNQNQFQKKIFWILIFTAVFSFTKTTAQNNIKLDYKLESKKANANYFDIVKLKKQEIASYDLTKLNDLKEYKHFNRWAEYWRLRVDANGAFTDENLAFYNAGILNSNGKLNTNNSEAKSTSAETWANIGTKDVPNSNGYPNFPQMGRLNAFLRIAHPSDTNLDILFVGAPNGGVWKSTDGGTSWSPKLDILAGIGVTDIKTSPTTTFSNYTTKPIYVSTGDWDGEHVKSIGVLKSTDGGENFSSTDLTFTLNENKLTGDLVVVDDNIVFVGTSTGISKTTNGGTSWSQVFDAQASNANIGRVAVSGNKIMYTGIFDAVFTSDYTNDNNWNLVNGSSGQFDKKAVALGEDNKFYIQDISGQIKVYDETSNTFSNHGTVPAEYNSQQGYNQALIVKNNMIISGEFNGTHSTDNGASWYRSLNGYWTDASSDGNYIHSDHHRLGSLDGNLKFWSANDGGLSYITYASNTDQKPIIEYKTSKTIVTQHFSVAINPNVSGDDYVVGNQDNDGFSKIDGVWYAIALGDGIESAINYNSPNIRYATNQNGIIVKSDDGFRNEKDGDYFLEPKGISFNHYLELDRTNPSVLYLNSDKPDKVDENENVLEAYERGIFKITDTGSELTSVNLDTGKPIHKFNTHGGLILGITDNNTIRKIPTDGSTATSITGAQSLSGNAILESVDFSASDTNIIYISTKGYNNGNKVFKSTNGGTSFTNISGNLPDVIINKILLKQASGSTTVFVATNVGVYFTSNDGTSWGKLGNGLPNVDVKDIEINYTADKLVAATFGRGLWSVNIENSTLGVSETATNKLSLSIYPNPLTTNNLKISTKENLTNLNYEIYNIVGGIVKKGALNATKEINVDALTNNVYLIRVFNNEYTSTKKFVLTK